MKTIRICCALSLLLSFSATAQDKQLDEFLTKLDISAIKNKAFFNKAVFTKGVLEMLRTKDKDEKGQPIMNIDKSHFKTFTNLVEQADLNNKPCPAAMKEIFGRTRNEVTENNIIPIGIINTETTFLTQEQIDENIKLKADNQKVNGGSYEIIPIRMAGLLQEEIFQGNVAFQISPDFLQSNIDDPIEKITIDFQDGKGEQSFELKNQLIEHQFSTLGTVAISIKVTTKKGSFLTYCPLQIRLLERPEVYLTKSISIEKVRVEETKGGRVATNITGGNYAIYLGCDGVLDKPIIIAEGFDVEENVNITTLVSNYYPYLYALRNNGYDLVFLNYTNGRDYIENNAEVLKTVINQINSLKVGNEKLTVVGESMSGLVARYALKTMENAGQTHNVGHFISFDSPQKGANVPPGLIALRRWASSAAFPLSLILDELNNLLNVFPFLTALDTPAGKQLLLTHNIVGPAPEYYALQNTLNNLGYPSQNGIRNVALVNGALNGANQSKFSFDINHHLVNQGFLQAGDKILDVTLSYFIGFISGNVWTNQVNQSTKVFEGLGFLLLIPSYEQLSVTLPVNYDRLAGGYFYYGIGNIPVLFSFVPTFSGIDYKGTLNNDADYTFSISNFIDSDFQVTNTSLTPFVAIYGDNANNIHTDVKNDQQAWNNIAIHEYGIMNPEDVLAGGCTLPVPSVAQEGRIQFKVGFVLSPLPSTLCKYRPTWKTNNRAENIILAVTGNDLSNYVQFIRISGNGITPYRLDLSANRCLFDYSNLGVGTYTITVVRQFYSGSGNSAGEVSSSTTIQIRGNCRIGVGCPEDADLGEVIGTLSETNESIYANKLNGIWFGTLEDGTVVSRNQLIVNGLDPDGAACFAEGCITVQSGNWDDPNTWLSGYVPTAREDIWVKSGHRVTLTPAMGIQKCRRSTVELGSVFDCTGLLIMDAK
jgi:pimeloyl-ACP methyl ester carboxylesterase